VSADARAEAERRRSAEVYLPDRLDYDMEVEAFVAGAEWTDAQREPLTATTRDHLITLIHTSGQSLTVTESAAVADAILAEFRPVASTREQLAEVRIPSQIARDVNLPLGAAGADAVLASGAVEDRAEVEAEALESVANNDGMGAAYLSAAQSHVLRARAQSIREGRS
jgi:hypothetical protein